MVHGTNFRQRHTSQPIGNKENNNQPIGNKESDKSSKLGKKSLEFGMLNLE
jgi:hypothetical protein